jgi:hypothetical protein
MQINDIRYGGWNHCLEIFNEDVRLIITLDVGPRIIFAGFRGDANLFYENPEDMGKTGGNDWRIYGGHRLWQSPEVREITYVPDNFPVKLEESRLKVRFTAPVEISGLQKIFEVTPLPDNGFTINHIFQYQGKKPVEIAPWALSVMRAGGVAIIPHTLQEDPPSRLLPTHPITLWSYTNLTDPRWTWGKDFILLHQDPSAETAQKVGLLNRPGWAAYSTGENIFIKLFPYYPADNYPDFNCNFECYTNNSILELESLGPLQTLQPGESLSHREDWRFFKQLPEITTEEGARNIIPPLLSNLKFS